MDIKWDELKEEMDKILVDMSDIGFAIEFAKTWTQIEDEGDRLAEENTTLDFLVRVAEKKQFEAEQKLEAIRKLMDEKQYMDEAILLKLKTLEVLDS